MVKITAVGDCGSDHYINQNKYLIGGIAFNFITNCQQLGGDTSIISCIGSEEKDQILDFFNNQKINASFLKIKPGNSPLQKIKILESGAREFVGYETGVLKKFKLSGEDKEFLIKQEVIYCPLSDGIEHIFEEIAELNFKGIKVADFSMDHENFLINEIIDYSEKFDISFLGGTKEMVDLLLPITKNNNKLIVVTMGEDGSVALKDGKKTFQEIIPVKVVDTTGCGDAFQAAFVMKYFETKNIALSLLSGAKHAAKIAQHFGGIEQ